MLRRLVLLALLTISVCGLDVSNAVAGLRCDPPAVNLGDVRGGPPRRQRIVLVNDGMEPVELLDVERGCGCLETQLDRRTLRPGEKAVLMIGIRTAGQANGPRSWNLRVRYRDGRAVREELIVVAATIRNEVTVEPSILALDVRGTLHQELVVTDLRSPPLRVSAVKGTHAALRATVQPSADGVTRVLLDVAASDLAEGRHDAILNIYTDDPLYSPLQVPVTLTRSSTPAVSVTPPRVQARVSAAAPVASTLVRLRRVNGQKTVIASAEADDLAVTCTWASGPGASATLKVRVDGRRIAEGDEPRIVRVRLADASHEVVTIPVMVERSR